MNRRTCACGTTIVCGDLDGYDVWLDQHEDGWISLDEQGHATVDSAGQWRSHTCAAEPEPPKFQPKPQPLTAGRLAALNEARQQRMRAAAQRTSAAAAAVLDAGLTLTALEQAVAVARVQHPDAPGPALAAVIGIRPVSMHSALHRISKYAHQLTQQAA